MASNFANNGLNLGIDTADFLTRYWQKRPKLMRHALRNFASPMNANDLAGLACIEGSLARIVQGTGKRFTVASGPFSHASFASLGATNWTLLVQEVDQWDQGVRALLKHFDFLPRWRIEDVMVSYAVRGGSVGAHVDQYDVFLLQGRGQRRWQIDDRLLAKTAARQRFLPKATLKLLADFAPNRDWVLSPGDMLYLPPGVPHHGVALDDDCMTFSIGLRAPSATELIENFARTQAQLLSENLRYSDPMLKSHQTQSVKLDHESVARVRSTLETAFQLSDAQLGAWFANFMSAYRAPALATTDKSVNKLAAIGSLGSSELRTRAKLNDRLVAGARLTLAPGMRVIEWQGALYIGGQKFSCEARMRGLLGAFTVNIDAEIWRRSDASEQALILKLKRAGALIFERRAAFHL